MAEIDGGMTLTDTTEPLRLRYDDSGTTDVKFAVSSGGDLTITPDGGDITLAANVTVTGTGSFTGTVSFPGGVTGNTTFSGEIICASTIRANGALITIQGAGGSSPRLIWITEAGAAEWNHQLEADGLDLIYRGAATPLWRIRDGFSGPVRFSVNADTGKVFIGDTANANMSQGLTINQGANDNEILSLKSTDVAHGVTTVTETDTYCALSKANGEQGGVVFTALREATAGGAYQLRAIGGADNTAKSTAALATILFDASAISGTGTTTRGADANLVAIRNNNTTRFIFDAEGSAHADVEWTTFDHHDDLAVIEDMETLLAPSQVQRRFGEVVKHDADFFAREGLLHDVRDVGGGRMRGMLNTTRALMLSMGAIRQVGSRVERLEDALTNLPGGPEALAQIGA